MTDFYARLCFEQSKLLRVKWLENCLKNASFALGVVANCAAKVEISFSERQGILGIVHGTTRKKLQPPGFVVIEPASG